MNYSCLEVGDKQKGGDIDDGLSLNPDVGRTNGHEVFSIESDDEDEEEVVNDVRKADDDDDEIEVFAEQTHNHGLAGNNASAVVVEKKVRKFCEFCTDTRRLEKCPNCPEFVVKLTDIYDDYGLCVAK